MGITLDTIERLRVSCSALPEVDKSKREVAKQEAVNRLKKEIKAMRDKGYTLDAIAEHFTKNELPISGKTLKSYLNRSAARPARKAAQKPQPATQAAA